MTSVYRYVLGVLLLAACERTTTPEATAPIATRAFAEITSASAEPSTRAEATGRSSISPSETLAPATLRVVRLTLGASDPSTPLPWVVAFHGLGDTPEGFRHLFDDLSLRAHIYLAQAPIEYGTGYDWLGVRVLGDPAKLALAVQERLPDIERLLSTLAEQPRNQGDAVVTGFSQGGILSYAVAVAGLPHVRATLPLAGWLPPSLANTEPALPVSAFHGENDAVVPFAATRLMIDAWRHQTKNGDTLSFRSYAGVAHSVSPTMRRDWADRLNALLR